MLERLSRVIFFTGLFLLPLISFPTIENGYELPKIIFFQGWVEILWLLIIVNWLLKKIRSQFSNNALVWLLIFYFVWNVITSLTGANPNNSVYGLFWRGQGLIMLAHYLAFVFLIPVLLTKSDLKKVAFTVVISGLIASLYIFSNLVTKKLFDWPIYLYLNRPVGTFGNPDFLAGFLAVILPLIFFWKQKPLRVIVLVPVLSALILAQSRGAVIALIATLFLVIVARLWSKHHLVAFLIIVISVVLSAWQLLIWLPVPLNSPTWASSRQRIWGRGVLAVIQRPLTGYGLENYQSAVSKIVYPLIPGVNGEVQVDKAHNEILEVLLASGAVGFIFWFGLILIAGKNLLSQKNYIPFSSLLIFLIVAQTNVVSTPEYVLY